ncbi:unnamed protein product [Prorocentrum cordatum]|uniref:40S ribosomal protein S24 n=2 Tax=Prorocentrum cordatum TaxID=2364126 RepID=A0ABN9V2P3_9DINO|nr:unnamed protein product [Polarella glacialis]
MSEFTVRTRKFKQNPLLGRKQFVLDIIHPSMANVSKADLAKKLAQMYKVHDHNCIQLFGFKTAFGGGRSSGFGLIYDNIDKAKKFEPKYRLKRAGLGKDKGGGGRRAKKDTKNRRKKVRGKEKSKAGGKKSDDPQREDTENIIRTKTIQHKARDVRVILVLNKAEHEDGLRDQSAALRGSQIAITKNTRLLTIAFDEFKLGVAAKEAQIPGFIPLITNWCKCIADSPQAKAGACTMAGQPAPRHGAPAARAPQPRLRLGGAAGEGGAGCRLPPVAGILRSGRAGLAAAPPTSGRWARSRLPAAVVAAGLLSHRWGAAAQVTWAPQPAQLSTEDDVGNHRRLRNLLCQAYATGYNEGRQPHLLMPSIRAEIADFRQRVPSNAALALAVGFAKYHFAWYLEGGAEMDVESVQDAADLIYLSIQFSRCNDPTLQAEAFAQRMCSSRWQHAVMIYSELGREYASKYMADQAATVLERALAVFDEMKSLSFFARWHHWQGPYDMNSNEEFFSGVVPAGPVWSSAAVPLAGLLEGSFQELSAELDGLLQQQGLFDRLHLQGPRADSQDHAPPGAWRAVGLGVPGEAVELRWDAAACRLLPRTCELLSARPELRGCRRAGASLVRMSAGGSLKPRLSAEPGLQVHLVLMADPGARMSVGNRTPAWELGRAVVLDDTHVRQEWHAGVRGESYVLQVSLCHPCEAAQRSLYAGSVSCPSAGAAADVTVLAKQAGGWAHLPSGVAAAGPFGTQAAEAGATMAVPFAAAALWAATLPELAACAGGIGEQCPPDTQHGGANPLSALGTWTYALNNLRAAMRHAGVELDPTVSSAISQVQGAIEAFLKYPALDGFEPIVASAAQIFQVLQPWLQLQPAAPVWVAARSPSAAALAGGTTELPLAGGLRMPVVGLGTWKLEGAACYNAVRWALAAGVRHVDTAEAYGNEADVGRAIRDSGVPRGDIFLATKATSAALGMAPVSQLESIFASQLQALQTEYVDVYMLHAAGVRGEELVALWRGMERLHDLGRARALGASNFGIEELEELWTFARVKPAYIQNIFKVYKQGEQIPGDSAEGVASWARRHQVAMVGYSVINSWPQLLPPTRDPHVLAVAAAHGRTPAQVLHRWALQSGVAVIPRASSKEHVLENAAPLDFELSPAELAALDGLATLAESTHDQLRPAWASDVYGLRASPGGAAGPGAPGPAALAEASVGPGAAGFQAVLRNAQCGRGADAVADPFTLGGGGHDLAQCGAACASQPACRFVTYYHRTGYCHMYRSCLEQLEAGDEAVIYALDASPWQVDYERGLAKELYEVVLSKGYFTSKAVFAEIVLDVLDRSGGEAAALPGGRRGF